MSIRITKLIEKQQRRVAYTAKFSCLVHVTGGTKNNPRLQWTCTLYSFWTLRTNNNHDMLRRVVLKNHTQLPSNASKLLAQIAYFNAPGPFCTLVQ